MAKFEQMITQDEYYACIKGCQIIDCVARNKDYFHFVEKMSKRRGTMSERKVAKRAGGFYKGDVPGKCAGNLSGRRWRDADGGHARRGLSRRQGAAVDI